jgi:hypothetical protein
MFIGPKSEWPAEEPLLDKDKTKAIFQAEGKVEVLIEKLNK